MVTNNYTRQYCEQIASLQALSLRSKGIEKHSDPSGKRPAIEFSPAQNREPGKSRKQDLMNSPSCPARAVKTRLPSEILREAGKIRSALRKTCGHGRFVRKGSMSVRIARRFSAGDFCCGITRCHANRVPRKCGNVPRQRPSAVGQSNVHQCGLRRRTYRRCPRPEVALAFRLSGVHHADFVAVLRPVWDGPVPVPTGSDSGQRPNLCVPPRAGA